MNLERRAWTLSSLTRLKLLQAIASGLDKNVVYSVLELSERLGLKVNVVSKHLSLLADAGFVRKMRSGKFVYVELLDDGVRAFLRSFIKLVSITESEDDIWT